MLIYFRVLKESFNFAINALRNNMLRTFLSLLGVTIGIFSIIAVLAAVDSLKQNVLSSFDSLDKSTINIMRRTFSPTEVPRWKSEQFPDISYEEYQFLKGSVDGIDAITYIMAVPSGTVRYESQTIATVGVTPVTEDYSNIEALQFEKGRFFNEQESNSGTPVIVLGSEIAENLFGTLNPIGKKIRLYGRKFNVVGVLKKEGIGLFGDSKDTTVMIPVNFTRRLFSSSDRSIFTAVILKPVKGIDTEEFIAALVRSLRQKRGLKPDEIDNFFVNQLAGLSDAIDKSTEFLNLAGIIISGFSLLVGGFGIANIMFVSVKERTNLIGIQKSLGAKNKFILYQFLFEAVILAVIGGLVGLFFVWIISLVASSFTGDFEFVLSPFNMFIGTAISAVIGLVSGIVPAVSASKLDPVEAIRTGM